MTQIPPDKLKIGKSLLAGGPVSYERLQQELEQSGKQVSHLGRALLQAGFPRESELLIPLLSRLKIPKIKNLKNTEIPLETIRLLPQEVALRCQILPVDQIGSILVVASPDLSNEAAFAEVRQVTGCLVTPIQCGAAGFEEIIREYYGRLGSDPGDSGPVSSPQATGAKANGTVQAIPAGESDRDAWWKRYMSPGPLLAEQVLR